MSISVVIVGTGNVAWHLTKAFISSHIDVKQVFGRNKHALSQFADELGVDTVSDSNQIDPRADFYIFCLSDSVIYEIANLSSFHNKFLIHTAGSVDIDIFKDITPNYGVMYPLQTFSKFRELDYAAIPFFVEGNNIENQNKIIELTKSISSHVEWMNSEDRLFIHMTAVIGSNFANHMYAIAAELLKTKNQSFDVLKPLILEVAQKAMENDPIDSQTGPAVRGNLEILKKHEEMLAAFPQWQKIYSFVSESIYQLKNSK